MVPFLLVGNSQFSIISIQINIILLRGIESIHYKFYRVVKTMALQSFSRLRKTFDHVYKNSFNNTTFIFIRLEYIEQFRIDCYQYETYIGDIFISW